MGDLVLTCTGDLSRNRSVGLQLGKGKTLDEVLRGMTMVAEGVRTTKSAHMLAEREGVEMPITSEIYRVLYEDKPTMDAVVSLMTRRLKHERA
jgi:glycerol-3-phosphate dehydrogenase (NAD(P)+)